MKCKDSFPDEKFLIVSLKFGNCGNWKVLNYNRRRWLKNVNNLHCTS